MFIAVENTARVCHEANRAFCATLGEFQPAWESAPEWQKKSSYDGVLFHFQGNYGPEDSHNNWMKLKEKDGWKYGELKDEKLKTHPCMMPYDKLPNSQQMKDTLFVAIVHAFKKQIERLQALGIE